LTPGGKRRVSPKSVNQRRYLEAIDQHDIVFGIGPAGTGKTYLAMAQPCVPRREESEPASSSRARRSRLARSSDFFRAICRRK